MPQPAPSSAPGLSRRSVLGLLGAVPLAAGGVLATGSSAHAHTDPARSDSIPEELRPGGEFDRFVAGRAARDQFSGALLLAHHGKPVLTRAYGMANRQESIPNRADTIFGLGSVSKTFVSVAVTQLVQRGTMSFDGTLGTYLDGFPAEIANRVTLHHLLTHTSGIGRPPVSRGNGQPQRPEPRSPEEAMEAELAQVRRLPLQFAPGTKHSYSNDGFLVLGAVVARVSGGSFYDYVREHVFGPAGMTRTDYLTNDQVLAKEDVAHPYARQRPGAPAVDGTTLPLFGSSLGPAGGGYSTVSDLLCYAVALEDGTLLEPALVEQITSGKVPVPPREGSERSDARRFYAYGFEDDIVGGQHIVGHSGGSTAGVATRFDIYPDLDWVAVLLTNTIEGTRPDALLSPVVDLERKLITRQGT